MPAILGAAAFTASPSGGVAPPRTPVLFELFTSEGCSSCPPADTLLTRMVTDQPIDGVEVVGLSLHVDYWNRLGWVDPFSKPAFTDRQNAYATIWGVSRIYTPQAVVDGVREFVGSDSAAAREYIMAAAAAPKVGVSVDVDPPAPGSDRVSMRIGVNASPARASKVELMLAVAENGLVSDVRRGENAERTLSHIGVVRSLTRVAQFDAARGLTTTESVRLDPAWRRDQLRLVAFAQDPVSHAVIGIAARKLPG
jgi:hypothetical protein